MDNIALNTIFYIMIFIFPGLLFRKFYFGGEFTKQFQQGNLMERFLWTLFFSVLIIVLSTLSFIFLGNHKYFIIQDYISYDTIKKLFESLSINKLPEKEDVQINDYLNFLYLILILYLISSVLGYVSYKFIRITNIDTNSFAFRYKNYWHYLIKSSKTYGNKNSRNKYLYTNVDVLVEYNGKQELFSGYVQNYFIDPISNKLESIILKNAYKFITVSNDEVGDVEKSISEKENIYELHKELKNKKIYKKYIPGDIFTIFNEKIVNLNLTYVEEVLTNFEKNRKQKIFINFVYYVLFVVIAIFPWVLQHELMATVVRKITINILLMNILILLKNYIMELLKLREKKEGFMTFITGVIFFSIPLLWIFKLTNWWVTLIVLFVYLILISIIINKIEPNKK